MLQGPEDPMLALPDDMSPLCFGECALAHLECSWGRKVSLDPRLPMDLPVLMSAGTANWTALLISI